MEDEERETEEPEGVFGEEVAIRGDEHVELLGEAVDGQGGQLAGVGVDVGEVVAGVVERTAGGEGEAARIPSTSIVSMRLWTPRCASRWFIGTLAWPSGWATKVR